MIILLLRVSLISKVSNLFEILKALTQFLFPKYIVRHRNFESF